jgi:hypothetical protein
VIFSYITGLFRSLPFYLHETGLRLRLAAVNVSSKKKGSFLNLAPSFGSRIRDGKKEKIGF